MIRRIVIAGVIAAGMLAPLSAAVPASAGNNVGCNGNDCSVLLSQFIHLSGDQGSGSNYTPIPLPPPPCLWEPIGDQTSGSNYVIGFYGSDPGPSAPFDGHGAWKKAKDLLKNPTAGTWYELPVNPAASAAGKAACLKLPLFTFVLAGQPPPIPPIPPRTLAIYAYNHMAIPTPSLTTNPDGKGYVNLGSYVWANWAASQVTGRPNAYAITATLGNTSVTVWAQVTKFSVSAIGPGKASNNCGPTGSHEPKGQAPANAGAGVAPDCGVLWRAPDAHAAVQATVTWQVSWGLGNLNGPGNHRLRPITMTGQTTPFQVSEVQSVNGN
jgi:hypothetical protein